MNGALGRAGRFERAVLLAVAAVVAAVSWGVMVRHAAWTPGAIHHALAPHHDAAAWGDAFAMWLVMMVAMMMPAVSPWILWFSAAHRRGSGRPSYAPAAVFAGGYFAAWAAYSLVASAGQIALQERAWLDAGLRASRAVGSGVLIAAGLFQLTPWKDSCLAHCRSPLSYFLARWREGPAGAFRMGLEHGLACVACCWALMAVGFALGVMNLLWMAALTAVLLAEQAAPHGRGIARAFGLGLAGWGVWWWIAGI